MKYAKWISALIILFVPLIAAAQLAPNEHIAAQVPFKFMVGDVSVPAGAVNLQVTDEKGWVLAISNTDVNLSRYVLASASQAKKAVPGSILVFRKYGDRYFLTSMKIGDSRTVYEFRGGKLESEMRAQNPSSEEVMVASAR